MNDVLIKVALAIVYNYTRMKAFFLCCLLCVHVNLMTCLNVVLTFVQSCTSLFRKKATLKFTVAVLKLVHVVAFNRNGNNASFVQYL